MRKAVCFEQGGLGDDDGPVYVERCDGFLAQVWRQFTQLKFCPFAFQRRWLWLHRLHREGFAGRRELLPFPTDGAGGVVNGCAVAAALYRLLQDGLIVHFDAFEFEVALPRVAPLVVFRQGVELLGVEVADGAQVQRVEDHVWVVGVHVLFEGVEVLCGEGAVFALVAPLLPAWRLGQVWRLSGGFVWSCGGVRVHTRLRFGSKVHFNGVFLTVVVGHCLTEKEYLHSGRFLFRFIFEKRKKKNLFSSFSAHLFNWNAHCAAHFRTLDQIF